MIETILVPVDGSANARQAVELASDTADKLEARLVLLHVCYGPRDIPERLRHQAEARRAGPVREKQPGEGHHRHIPGRRRHWVASFFWRRLPRPKWWSLSAR